MNHILPWSFQAFKCYESEWYVLQTYLPDTSELMSRKVHYAPAYEFSRCKLICRRYKGKYKQIHKSYASHTYLPTHLNFCSSANTNTLRKNTTLLPISSPGATWAVTWKRSTSLVNTISLYSPKQDSCRGKKKHSLPSQRAKKKHQCWC